MGELTQSIPGMLVVVAGVLAIGLAIVTDWEPWP